MQTLSAPVTTQAAAQEQAWLETYDLYLRAAIVTPWGTTSIIRLCTLPGGFTHYAPNNSPEPAATQGAAAVYQFWPITRDNSRSTQHTANDQIQFSASNVTSEFAALLASIDFTDTPVVIRLVPNVTPLTNTDNATLFTGNIDSISISEKALTFTASSDLGGLKTILPRESMHAACRFRFADDQCCVLPYHPDTMKHRAVTGASTTTRLAVSTCTEDNSPAPYSARSATTAASNTIADTAHGLDQGARITFTAASPSVPSGLSLNLAYFLVTRAANSFQLSLTQDGDPITFTNSGATLTYSCDTPPGGVDYIDSVTLCPTITPCSQTGSHPAVNVRDSVDGHWHWDETIVTLNNGYRYILPAQAGLQNHRLAPWIQFELASPAALRTWKLKMPSSTQRDALVSLVLLFSSDNGSDWTFQRYFRAPPLIDHVSEFCVQNAPSATYWRLCIRNWHGLGTDLNGWSRVSAYATGRNHWRHGQVVFADDTATAALRGVVARVSASYGGTLDLDAPLPAAPAVGDTFTLTRGCGRVFNDCAERQNTENYGGFDELASDIARAQA